jgi:hypothetical protein
MDYTFESCYTTSLEYVFTEKQVLTAIYFLDFIHRPYVLSTTMFRGMALPLSSGEPTLVGPVNRASLYRWTCFDCIQSSLGSIALFCSCKLIHFSLVKLCKAICHCPPTIWFGCQLSFFLTEFLRYRLQENLVSLTLISFLCKE